MFQRKGLLNWLLLLGGSGGLLVGILVACELWGDEATQQATNTTVVENNQGNNPPPPLVGRRVIVGERAGEFERILEEMAAAGGSQTLTRLTESGLTEPAVAFFAAPGQREPRLTFSGGTFTKPLAEGEVAAAAKSKLDAAFGGTVHNFDGQTRSFDAGPLGGEVRCTTLTAKAVSRKFAMCGWVDRWTMGYLVDSSRAGSEAELAALLVAMRPDLEKTK